MTWPLLQWASQSTSLNWHSKMVAEAISGGTSLCLVTMCKRSCWFLFNLFTASISPQHRATMLCLLYIVALIVPNRPDTRRDTIEIITRSKKSLNSGVSRDFGASPEFRPCGSNRSFPETYEHDQYQWRRSGHVTWSSAWLIPHVFSCDQAAL